MSEQVRVEDSEVFNVLRIALLKFAQAADSALCNAETQVSRTHFWLDGEQSTYWEHQHHARAEAVTKARDAVRQKKLYRDATGRVPGAVEEEKALRKCLAALDEAQQKLDAIRKWKPRLEKEADLYRGGVNRLKTLEDDIPRAVALLERLAMSVEQYVQIETPAAPLPESAAPAAPQDSLSRGGDAVEPPAGSPLPKPKPEDRHVGDGQ